MCEALADELPRVSRGHDSQSSQQCLEGERGEGGRGDVLSTLQRGKSLYYLQDARPFVAVEVGPQLGVTALEGDQGLHSSGRRREPLPMAT